jgi:hypothetical protein
MQYISNFCSNEKEHGGEYEKILSDFEFSIKALLFIIEILQNKINI